MAGPTDPEEQSQARREAFHAQRFAVATSDRERAAAAYSRLQSAVAKVRPDANRDAIYRDLENYFDIQASRLRQRGRG